MVVTKLLVLKNCWSKKKFFLKNYFRSEKIFCPKIFGYG